MYSPTPTERFRKAARSEPDRNLDFYSTRNCAAYGSANHFRRINADGSEDYAGALCDRWSCTRCAPRLRNNLVRDICAAVVRLDLNQWLHLTLRHDTDTRPRHYALKLLRKWGSLRALYQKQFGVPLPFVWLKQVEGGWPHLHIFTRGLDLAWVKSQWRKRTGAFEIKLQDIDPATMPVPALYATRLIHANALEYGRVCGRWCGASAGIRLNARGRGKGDGSWKFVKGRLDLGGYSPEEYDVIATDRVLRPTHVLIKAKGGEK